MSRHMLPHFHCCAGCWKWVCDCIHCVDPLGTQRHPVKDLQIRSVGYDRRRGRLEIEYTWTDDVRHIYPESPVIFRQLLAARPMYLFLDRIYKMRGVRFVYVRTEAKQAIMMAGIGANILSALS
jgi:hypothetical protein